MQCRQGESKLLENLIRKMRWKRTLKTKITPLFSYYRYRESNRASTVLSVDTGT